MNAHGSVKNKKGHMVIKYWMSAASSQTKKVENVQ